MNSIKLKIKDKNVKIPEIATEGSAGIDLYAHSFISKYTCYNHKLEENHLNLHYKNIHINTGERLLVGTGLFMEIPKGYQLDIRPRSGSALKQGLIVVNSPGTIDSDYRGEIGIILSNISKETIYINLEERIAQGVFIKYEKPTFEIVEELSSTDRGEGGFGSTNNK